MRVLFITTLAALIALTHSAISADKQSRTIRVHRIVDGDTFTTKDGETIRIWGMDTPERNQFGHRRATEELIKMIKGKRLQCHQKDTDRYRRLVMQCFINGEDIGAAMVASGWARDYKRYSKGHYDVQERSAKRLKVGLW